MTDSRYSPFLYDGIDFSKPSWRRGDRNCRRNHHSAPELNRLVRETEVRVRDQENSVHLLVDIPGIKGKDLLVRIDGGLLKIEGSRMLTSGESTTKFKFSKNFLIDDSLDVTKLKAVLEKGVLAIEVQKKGRPVWPNSPIILSMTSSTQQTNSPQGTP